LLGGTKLLGPINLQTRCTGARMCEPSLRAGQAGRCQPEHASDVVLPFGPMRVLMGLLAVTVFGVAPCMAADALAEARRLYNDGHYETAARYAREALKVPATMESARLVLGRIYLEQFRQSADAEDLTRAREALRAVEAQRLGPRERAELIIGLSEHLFLEHKFGTAAESFERALDSSGELGPAAHERVLDWWATAVDRLALTRPRPAREQLYARVAVRMEKELALDPASAPAAYWLAAALRGSGNLERAWHTAIVGWIGAILGRDRGAALRADLDRLVIQGIIPERAAKLQPGDAKQAGAVMLAEWEAVKNNWSR
jgi:tetratricopeptide (TPR) repeat protein